MNIWGKSTFANVIVGFTLNPLNQTRLLHPSLFLEDSIVAQMRFLKRLGIFFLGSILTTPSKKVLEKVEKSIALVCKLQPLLHRIFTFAYYYTAELYYGDNTFDILCKIDGDKFTLTILTWKNLFALLNSIQKFIEFKVGCFWRFHIFTQSIKFF